MSHRLREAIGFEHSASHEDACEKEKKPCPEEQAANGRPEFMRREQQDD